MAVVSAPAMTVGRRVVLVGWIGLGWVELVGVVGVAYG
jgi:hypothetical protein